jgi:hypothetical protein
VTVCGCPGDLAARNGAARAGPILDDDGLTQTLA